MQKLYLTLFFICGFFPQTILGIQLNLIFEDRLSSGDTVPGEEGKYITEGAFVNEGWQSTSGSSQMVIALSNVFEPNESGAIEIDVTNFNPIDQYSSSKQQFINLYSFPDGNQNNWHDTDKCWWNLRGGTNYMESGGAGFKFLWAPASVDSRHEVRLIHSRTNWSTSETYTFRIEWSSTELTLHLDGQRLHGPVSFGGRSGSLKYIFLGKDNNYPGFSGPIYKAVRVYGEGAASDTQPPLAPQSVQASEIDS